MKTLGDLLDGLMGAGIGLSSDEPSMRRELWISDTSGTQVRIGEVRINELPEPGILFELPDDLRIVKASSGGRRP